MTSTRPARTFSADFKRFFVRGLVILLPSVLTLWILFKAYQFVDSAIAEPINGWVRLAIARATPAWEPLQLRFEPTEQAIDELYLQRYSPPLPLPGEKNVRRDKIRKELRVLAIRDWWRGHWYLDLIGLVVAIVTVYVAGRLLGGFVGRRLYKRLEDFITTLPVFRQVYPHVKQVVDFLFSDERSMRFSRVVGVQYPRRGIWSVGFVTGERGPGPLARVAGNVVTVFVPSSPTPFTGYTITVSRDEVIEIPMSVEEAIRFVVSGGVLTPDRADDTPASLPEAILPGPEPFEPRRRTPKSPSPAGQAADTET
jgi:uncharacterized membrane protein